MTEGCFATVSLVDQKQLSGEHKWKGQNEHDRWT
jgi:hypothetical protein